MPFEKFGVNSATFEQLLDRWSVPKDALCALVRERKILTRRQGENSRRIVFLNGLALFEDGERVTFSRDEVETFEAQNPHAFGMSTVDAMPSTDVGQQAAPADAKSPMEVKQQAAPVEQSEGWKIQAKFIALEYLARHIEKDLHPSQRDVCGHVEGELRKRQIFGSHHKPLSAAYILRNAISGAWWQANKR